MERSDAVTSILNRIMKVLDRLEEARPEAAVQFGAPIGAVETGRAMHLSRPRARRARAGAGREIARRRLSGAEPATFASAALEDPLAGV